MCQYRSASQISYEFLRYRSRYRHYLIVIGIAKLPIYASLIDTFDNAISDMINHLTIPMQFINFKPCFVLLLYSSCFVKCYVCVNFFFLCPLYLVNMQMPRWCFITAFVVSFYSASQHLTKSWVGIEAQTT